MPMGATTTGSIEGKGSGKDVKNSVHDLYTFTVKIGGNRMVMRIPAVFDLEEGHGYN